MSFSSDLKMFNQKLTEMAPRTVLEIGEDLLVNIKELTPVDKGRAKAGWDKVTTNEYSTIFNDVEYIVFLEEGSSTQAPNGMVKVSIRKMIIDINRGKYNLR